MNVRGIGGGTHSSSVLQLHRLGLAVSLLLMCSCGLVRQPLESTATERDINAKDSAVAGGNTVANRGSGDDGNGVPSGGSGDDGAVGGSLVGGDPQPPSQDSRVVPLTSEQLAILRAACADVTELTPDSRCGRVVDQLYSGNFDFSAPCVGLCLIMFRYQSGTGRFEVVQDAPDGSSCGDSGGPCFQVGASKSAIDYLVSRIAEQSDSDQTSAASRSTSGDETALPSNSPPETSNSLPENVYEVPGSVVTSTDSTHDGAILSQLSPGATTDHN